MKKMSSAVGLMTEGPKLDWTRDHGQYKTLPTVEKEMSNDL